MRRRASNGHVSIVPFLSDVLGPIRLSPAQRGVNVTFEGGGRWRTMHVIEEPHLELSIAVPELDGVRVHAHLGPATVLGNGEPVDDVRWRVRTDAPGLAAAIFGEAPWPRGTSAPDEMASPDAKQSAPGVGALLKTLAGVFLGPLGLMILIPDEVAMADPVPLYVLDLECGTASIERRDGELDPTRALGMVRRLVQLATWPDRALASLRELAAQLGGELQGERWAPAGNAITIRRVEATIRIDHEVTRSALRTRVRVLDVDGGVDAADATAYLEGVACDADLVGRTIDALVAKVARPAGRGPYR